MPTALRFLLASRHCQLDALQQLTLTVGLARECASVVHAIQMERGLANLHLASQEADTAYRSRWLAQAEMTDTSGQTLLAAMEAMARERSASFDHGARLYSRMAHATEGLSALPALRQAIGAGGWDPTRASAAYSHLVQSLLSMVFEAAEAASDPDISRLLVAFSHFVQAKEWAGQERAAGGALFARGQARAEDQPRLLTLQDLQSRCLETAALHAPEHLLSTDSAAAWREGSPALQKWRRLLQGNPPVWLDTARALDWFETCTHRLNGMRQTETAFAESLSQLAVDKRKQAQQSVSDMEELAQDLNRQQPQPPVSQDGALVFFETARWTHATADDHNAQASALSSHPRERALLALVHQQSALAQKLSEQLDNTRTTLQERKVIERAKGLLMAHERLDEDGAHRWLQQRAMEHKRRLVDVAQSVLAGATRPLASTDEG